MGDEADQLLLCFLFLLLLLFVLDLMFTCLYDCYGLLFFPQSSQSFHKMANSFGHFRKWPVSYSLCVCVCVCVGGGLLSVSIFHELPKNNRKVCLEVLLNRCMSDYI